MQESTILQQLNEKQRDVVTATPSHLAVIAGAGSGKTRVLVHRIAWLIEKEHLSPSQLLAVTFTNKAAAEMRDRVEKITGLSVRPMWLGTFHGLAHRFLRYHWQEANLPQMFQILDADDQYRLIRKVHHSLNLHDDKWPPSQSQWYINKNKDDGLRPGDILTETHVDKILHKVYEVYEAECQRQGLVDFAELLLKSYEVLNSNASLLSHYQQRFVHILVDEFQDTNAIQYQWLTLLAGKTAMVMIVGDDDQSIYSWRGARIENIHRFSRDFPARVIRLEQNYRSTKTILAAANAVILHNQDRFGKNLWTEDAEGDAISLYAAFNDIDEARYIVSNIKSNWNGGNRLSKIAILYRSNAQSRVLEEELLNANIPYRIYGGLKFFERAEIKDTLAYLRLLANPHDDAAFERAVNMPPRGIGNTTLATVRDEARLVNLSLWETSEMLCQQGRLSSRAIRSLTVFLNLIKELQAELYPLPLSIQTKEVIHRSGLHLYYSKDLSDKTASRLENLEELIQSTEQFKSTNEFSLPPLQDYLSYVALESGETQANVYEDSVQLMTLHAAKGLEFETVFLSGMEEGLFPHRIAMEDSGRLEEERRLCYVGMTRACKKLILSYAEVRRVNGKQMQRQMSRFIREIPDTLIEEVRLRTKVTRPIQYTMAKHVSYETGIGFRLGERVKHPHFGEGVVLNYEGQGESARVQVRFGQEGTKWLVMAFAKLEKVSN